MCDTFKPLFPTKAALKLDDENYPKSWQGEHFPGLEANVWAPNTPGAPNGATNGASSSPAKTKAAPKSQPKGTEPKGAAASKGKPGAKPGSAKR
jgi:hypothetical protein